MLANTLQGSDEILSTLHVSESVLSCDPLCVCSVPNPLASFKKLVKVFGGMSRAGMMLHGDSAAAAAAASQAALAAGLHMHGTPPMAAGIPGMLHGAQMGLAHRLDAF